MKAVKYERTEVILTYVEVLEKLKQGYVVAYTNDLDHYLDRQARGKKYEPDAYGMFAVFDLESLFEDADFDDDDDDDFEIDIVMYANLFSESCMQHSRLLIDGNIARYLHHVDNELAKKYTVTVAWTNRPNDPIEI
jgi:hypothetical protein